ncbi:MAG: hypothetical protein D6689_11795, partial [Deltaproteobacteria bacterium]
GADVRTANFAQARLLAADLTGVDAARAVFRDAELERADVRDADFTEADLRAARLAGLRNYTCASFVRTDIRDIDFSGAYLVRRHIMDENFLAEFREQSRASRIAYWIWWVTSDCGRSVVRWGLWTLLIAVLFGVGYIFTDVSFGDRPTALSPFYFSVVTLTTLGYGDVLPKSPAAQSLAMIEVAIGYVMLGGLLSIFANKMARRAD